MISVGARVALMVEFIVRSTALQFTKLKVRLMNIRGKGRCSGLCQEPENEIIQEEWREKNTGSACEHILQSPFSRRMIKR